MKVKVAQSVRNRLRENNRWYLRRAGEQIAERINNNVLAVIASLSGRVRGHKFDEALPDCYRINVAPLVIFYYRNAAQKYVLVYSLRHGRQRPMQSRIHKSLISKAERSSGEL